MAVIARGQVTVVRVEDGQAGAVGASIVYRGEFSATATYYNNSVRRDVVKRNDSFFIYKGTNGKSGAWKASDWENFGGQYESVATELLLAENANLGGFIFSGGKLISQKGTLNGAESTDYENVNFVPYITLDGTNGTALIHKGEFYGGVRTMFYPINSANCASQGNGVFKVTDRLNLCLDLAIPSNYETTVMLPSDSSFIGKTVNIHNGVFALTKSSLMWENTLKVVTEGNHGIYYKPFLGTQTQMGIGYQHWVQEIEFLGGTLTFLAVPNGGDSATWICLNYPENGSGSSSGGSSGGSGNVSASGTLPSGYVLIGASNKNIAASSVKISQTTFQNSTDYLVSGKAIADYVSSNALGTGSSSLSSGIILVGAGGKKVKTSGLSFEQNLTADSTKVPTSSAVKTYVDNKVAGAGSGTAQTEWYNIYNAKGDGNVLYTYIENIDTKLIGNSRQYRMVLLKFRKQHHGGRKWSMPMFLYEMYRLNKCRKLPPNDISERNASWVISNNPTPWFAETGDDYTQVLSLNESENTATGVRQWANTRNKKMRVGVAIYKYTGTNKIGWHRISNIAYIELYKQNLEGHYLVNVMP